MAFFEKKNDRSREEMSAFWGEHSKEASLEKMFLDSEAKKMQHSEEAEIMNAMCDVKDKMVLELGSGIGRYTAKLAAEAKHVTCVDFMESFVLKNKETNGHLKNITFLTADVTKLEFEQNRFDVVFSNWILMYLSDNEVNDLLVNILKWTKPEAKVFFRESCFRRINDSVGDVNPSVYRTPSFYCGMFQHARTETMGLNTVYSRNLKCYLELKKVQNQCLWLLEKVVRTNSQPDECQNDNQQYTKTSVELYDRIFGGHGYPGGMQTTEELVAMLDLKSGQKVLDVGSGIGGSAFYMEKEHGADVLGIDLSANMFEMAMKRSPQESMVRFQMCDVTTVEFEPASFDVIYSRDTLMHISDKLEVFKKFCRWLKAGGKLLISDYCLMNDCDSSEKFKEYVGKQRYVLYTVQRYSKILEEAGFVNVKVQDKSGEYVNDLKQTKQRCEKDKSNFIKDVSEDDYRYVIDGLAQQLDFVEAGEQGWCIFYSETPLLE